MKGGKGQQGGPGPGPSTPVAIIRPLNVSLDETESHWVVLSRKGTQPNLHFRWITLAAVGRIDCWGQEWELGAELGGAGTIQVRGDGGGDQRVAIGLVRRGCIWHLV